MAFSSLADELAGAFDDDPSLDEGVGAGLGQSLADEFGLDYGLEHGLEHGEADNEFDVGLQHPSTPPSRNGNLSKTTTPPRDDAGRRTAKTSYEPTNLDDISPNRGIDLDLELELELEYGQNHSFSSQPHFQDEDSYNYQYEQDHLDNLPTTASPVRVRGIQNKSSTRSLRVNPRSSVRSLRALNGNEKEEGIQEALIILSEGISTNSRLLNSLQQINHHHQEGEEEIEIRLQRHLNRMNEVERTRDEWIRDLGIWSREVGLGGLEGNGRLGDGDDKLIDVNEEDEEEEEGESLGWTGESIIDDNDHLFEGEEISKNPQVSVSHEKDHINPHDSLLLDEDEHDSFPTYPSDQSILSPITPSKHHQPAQDLPKLIMAIQKDTDILLLSLRNLQDTIHITTSFHTSLTRMMKGIRSSIDSYRERGHVEEQARRKIEEWEAERLKIGLTRKNAGGGEEGWTIKEKLDKECREFEDVLERYGDRLKGLEQGTRRVGVAA